MAAMTVRNLSDETYRALKVRAAHNNRSAEAEVRAILDEVVQGQRIRLGSLLADIGQPAGVDFSFTRSNVAHEPLELL